MALINYSYCLVLHDPLSVSLLGYIYCFVCAAIICLMQLCLYRQFHLWIEVYVSCSLIQRLIALFPTCCALMVSFLNSCTT